MLLVFMDLATGYLLLEEVADDRTYATWKALVEERLKGLGTGVLYMVSDRAKALIQLAEKGLECLSMPDFFHVVHEIIKSYSLALGRHQRQAHQERKQAQEALARCHERPYADHDAPEATSLVAARQAAVNRWEEAHTSYRSLLETLSLTLHPFRIADSAPQTSAQVASHLQATVAAIEELAQDHQLPVRHAAMTKVRKQLPGLAAVVDFWWAGGRRDVAHAALSPLWQQWAEEVLLPRVYWEHHVAHTRCPRRKAKLRQALEAIQGAFDQHALTQCLPPHALQAWHAWATAPSERLSACLVSRGGPQRLPRATASQSARLTKTAVQGVDGLAQLRLSRGGWYDTSFALFQATVPGPLRNSVILYRDPASTTEAKTPSCPISLKSLGVPP
jgi:hypothetical protein